MYYGTGQFPYTNFHELNLDWIIDMIKQLKQDNVSFEMALNQIRLQIEAMQNTITEDVYNQLHQMVEDGTFADILTNFSGFVKQIDTTQAMLADETLEPGVLVQTAGFYGLGDGGGALFLITGAETLFPLANGAYAIIIDDPTNIKAYGAKGDGIANDTIPFDACMRTSHIVRLPKTSESYVLGAITLPEGCSVVGEDTAITAAESSLFTIAHSNTSIAKLTIDGTNYSAIVMDLEAESRFIYIDDIKAYNAEHLLYDVSENYYTNFYMNRCYGIDITATGVEMHKARAFIFLDDVTIDIIRTMPNSPAFAFEECRGMQLRHCEAEGGKTPGHIHMLYNVGFSFKSCVAVWLDRCMADTLDGIGFEVANTCEYMYLSQCVASLCGSHAFMLAGSYMTFTNCFANGNVLEDYPLQNVHGFNIYKDVVMSGCRSTGFTGAGLYVHSTAMVTVSSLMSTYCGIGILGEASAKGVITGSVISATTGTQDIPETLHLANNLINNVYA